MSRWVTAGRITVIALVFTLLFIHPVSADQGPDYGSSGKSGNLSFPSYSGSATYTPPANAPTGSLDGAPWGFSVNGSLYRTLTSITIMGTGVGNKNESAWQGEASTWVIASWDVPGCGNVTTEITIWNDGPNDASWATPPTGQHPFGWDAHVEIDILRWDPGLVGPACLAEATASYEHTLSYSDNFYNPDSWGWQFTRSNVSAWTAAMVITGLPSEYGAAMPGIIGGEITSYYTVDWANDYDIINDPATGDKSVHIQRGIGGKMYYSKLFVTADNGTAFTGAATTDNTTDNFGEAYSQIQLYSYATDQNFTLWDDRPYNYSTPTPPAPPVSLGAVNVTGHVLDGTTGSVVGGVNINATQSGYWFNTTSHASLGTYLIGGLGVGAPITFFASKAGWVHSPVEFTPLINTTYNLDLIVLLPEYIANNTAMDGLVYTDWSHEFISGATVSIANSSWSDTYTTTGGGFYMFDNLLPGDTYTLSATAPGHHASVNYNRIAQSGAIVQQDICLVANYLLTVYARDYSTSALLSGVNVYIELSDGQTGNTSTGSKIFNVNGGLFTVTGTATGYTAAQQQILVTSDTTVTLLFTNTTTSAPAAVRYLPKIVRLVFVNQFGHPIVSAGVNATATEATSPWNWLLDLFGIPSSVAMQNTTLSGTTDSAGSIDFTMNEMIKYNINILNSTAGINKTFSIYPKEDQYTFQVDTETVVANLYDRVKWNLSSYDFSATEISVNLTYNDSYEQTTSLIFYVNNSLNGTPIYSQTFSSLTDGNVTTGYVITNTAGTSIDWGFIAQNSIFGTIEDMMGLTMKGPAAKLVDLHLTSDAYLWISYLILFTVGGLFSYANIRFGAIILPFVAGGLWWIGWLSISWVLLGSLMALGALVYINRSEVKVR